jgi:regulator of replication initiation timing
MDHHTHEGLSSLVDEAFTRISELEERVSQLGQQLDSLSEHLEWRFQRVYDQLKLVDEDARRRAADLEYQVDRVRSDAEGWARDASAGRGW